MQQLRGPFSLETIFIPFEKRFILLRSLIRSLYNLFSPDNAVDGRKLGIFFLFSILYF